MPPSNRTEADRAAERPAGGRAAAGAIRAHSRRSTAATRPGCSVWPTGMTGSRGRRRGPAAGDLPAGPPETRQLQGRGGARDLDLPAGDELLRGLPEKPAAPGAAGDRRTRRSAAAARVGPRRCASSSWISSGPSRDCRPGYRAAFVLHDVEGFEHAEVAATAGDRRGHLEVAGAQGADEDCATCWPGAQMTGWT